MAHHCSTLLVRCMDFRLEKAIHHGFLEPQNLCGDCDIVAVAGGAKGLASDDPEEQRTLLDHIALARKLHGVTRVLLMNHTDCGAYGGSAAFSSSEEELKKHEGELARARETGKAAFPDLTVETVLARILEDSAVEFDSVPVGV